MAIVRNLHEVNSEDEILPVNRLLTVLGVTAFSSFSGAVLGAKISDPAIGFAAAAVGAVVLNIATLKAISYLSR